MSAYDVGYWIGTVIAYALIAVLALAFLFGLVGLPIWLWRKTH